MISYAKWILQLIVTFCTFSCRTIPIVAREVCVVHTEPEPGLPRLYRRANAHALGLGSAQLLCDVPRFDRKLADRCEDVDDLSALLGTGTACGPMGRQAQAVCPSYAHDRLREEPAASPSAPCAAACPNRQIALHEESGTVTRLLFYDDPECHAANDPACPGSEKRCYYRVLSITTELR